MKNIFVFTFFLVIQRPQCRFTFCDIFTGCFSYQKTNILFIFNLLDRFVRICMKFVPVHISEKVYTVLYIDIAPLYVNCLQNIRITNALFLSIILKYIGHL